MNEYLLNRFLKLPSCKQDYLITYLNYLFYCKDDRIVKRVDGFIDCMYADILPDIIKNAKESDLVCPIGEGSYWDYN